MNDAPPMRHSTSPGIGDVLRPITLVGMSFIEARPLVQGLALLRLVVGNVLGSPGGRAETVSVILTDSSWLLANWVVYVLNGLSDVDGDRRNASTRPLASGRMSPRAAWVTVCLIAAVSLCLAAPGGLPTLAWVVAFLAVGAAYSFGRPPLKDHAVTASLTVGAAGSSTYLFGSLAADGRLSAQVVVTAAVLGGWMLVAGNAKDFGDEAGDELAGRRTLPVVLGGEPARRVVSRAVLATGGAAVVAGAAVPGLRPLALLAVAAVLMARAWSPRSRSPGPRTGYRIFMWSQYSVNVALIGGVLVATPGWFGGP